ncbi:hypothetical protein MKW94_006470 [Papaver nudicaule]|uniref:histone deacetylase n=1 Tax=Papaver nudicaule TaxID=74823 RepID=A0AA42AUM9_PAPNU|nr:hypothetical protein [Papaver nudicaule]
MVNKVKKTVQPRVGLVYDTRMLKHFTPGKEYHHENPNRIKHIWERLESAGITQRCVVMTAKEAEDKYVALVHEQYHVQLIKNISSKEFDDSDREMIALNCDSIYLNKGSSEAAFVAVGAVMEVTEKVAKGELDSAVAIVRPPGHHATPDLAGGFCLFNNVAVAAKYLLDKRPGLGIRKILIVDWDVHHGNGTQKVFWDDNRVLVFSVHRYDHGKFYPSGKYGSHSMIGEGLGAGYTVNVPWEGAGVGDADYFAVWDHVLIPITKAFNPDIILISGGFDAAVGDPLGKCRVTPFGFSVMMKKLMDFAKGKIVMALEGGYNLESLADSVLACVKTLLNDKPGPHSQETPASESSWRVIKAVRRELSKYWPVLANELPMNVVHNSKKKMHHKQLAAKERLKREETEALHSVAEHDIEKLKERLVAAENTVKQQEAESQGKSLHSYLYFRTSLPKSESKAAKLEAEKSVAEVEAAVAKQQAVELTVRAAKLEAEKSAAEAEAAEAKQQMVEAQWRAAKLEAEKSAAEAEAAEAKQQVVEAQWRAATAEKKVVDAEQLVSKERQQREALKKAFDESFKHLKECSTLLAQ